jgi:CrcB protein
VAEYLWVGLGGFLGANARYALGNWIADRLGSTFPWHTFAINVTGSLAIGVILTLLTDRLVADPAWRLFLVVGFLGGYTTFSSYTFEALTLVADGAWLQALGYGVGSNVVGLAAAYCGIILAHALAR